MKSTKFLRLLALKLLVLPLLSFNIAHAETPDPRPNLQIDVSMNGDTLEVKQINTGGPVDTEQGGTHIWLNGERIWTYSWFTYTESKKTFLDGYNSSVITPQALTGTTEVKACIDPENIVDESNESDNCVTRILTSTTPTTTRTTLPDLRLFLEIDDTNHLNITHYNENNVTLPDSGYTYIYVDEMNTPSRKYRWSDYAPSVKQFLQPYSKGTANPIIIQGTQTIKVCIDALNIVQESNESNNCVTQRFTARSTNSNNCTSPLVPYQGQCVDPIPACQNPPAHFMPSTCIDKIKDGVRTPNYNFQCEEGYSRSGSVCVKTTDSSSGKYVGFFASSGNEQAFTTNERFTLVGKAVEMPSGEPASIEKGWSMKASLSSNINGIKGAPKHIDIAELDYNNGYWYAKFIAPEREGNFIITLTMTCKGPGYGCYDVPGNNSLNVHIRVEKKTETVRSTGLKYDVEITSNPVGKVIEGTGSAGKTSTELVVKVGDVIYFTQHIENKNAVNAAWDWNFGDMLKCAGTPDWDSPVQRCTVTKNGMTKVSLTMFPTTADGKQYTIYSNTIYVTTDTKNPTTRPADNTNITRTSGNTNYEDDVRTAEGKNPFSDTSMDSLEGKAAAYLHSQGIIGGFADGTFRGGREVNRAELAKFLLLTKYETVKDISNNGYFTDVKNGEWYTKYVITAAGLGIINGYSDGNFKPAQGVNTAEFLKMFTKTFGLTEKGTNRFTDVPSDAWYSQFTGVAVDYDLFPNRTTTLNASKVLTRNEVAVALYQYLMIK